MLTVATLLWTANAQSKSFSAMYTPEWVEKLYRGFARNLTRPFRFVCYSERSRTFAEAIECRPVLPAAPTYADCVRPFEMGEPMILVGLDTIVCGNIDHLADYCLNGDVLALPRDPYMPKRTCNGVCLVPDGHEFVWSEWNGKGSDMDRCRAVEHVYIDDLWPGHVASYKGSVKAKGLRDVRVCYFHGLEKAHQLPAGHPLLEHWR